MEEGAFNWFKGQELHMYLLFHTNRYQDAYKLYKNVLSNKRYESLTKRVKEKWQIFKAYIHLLVEVELIEVCDNDKSFTKFRLGKFL